MRVRPRSLLLGLLGLVVVLVLGLITAVGWQVVLGPDARPLTDRTFERTPARLARGEYLVNSVDACFHCHSEHDPNDPELPILPGTMGSGGPLPIPELGDIWSANITPDPETGIGTWSDDAIARAIREGVDADGRALAPVMPYEHFRNMDAEDVASIVVYLRTIPAVKKSRPRSKLVAPVNILVNTMPKPITGPETPPARTTAEARGSYLVNTLANCEECHTPIDDHGKVLPGMFLGGGHSFHDLGHPERTVVSLNITSDPSGIAHYDEALFIQTLHTGLMGGRVLNHIMPFNHFKTMTDDDLRDIFAYLKSVPQVKHRVSNTDPPALCVLCKQSHGLGEKNIAAK